MAILGYWHAHLAMIAGIVVAAAGVQEAVADLARPAHGTAACLLAVGVAVYLAGEAAFRLLLRIGPSHVRLAASGLALATVPVELRAGSLLQLAVLVVLLAGMLAAERRLLRA